MPLYYNILGYPPLRAALSVALDDKDCLQGAEYCQRTLQRQLESGAFEPLVRACMFV